MRIGDADATNADGQCGQAMRTGHTNADTNADAINADRTHQCGYTNAAHRVGSPLRLTKSDVYHFRFDIGFRFEHLALIAVLYLTARLKPLIVLLYGLVSITATSLQDRVSAEMQASGWCSIEHGLYR